MRTTVGRFSPPRSRGDGGFTLIELMVTMVVAGLLMALAVGGYRAYAASQAQRGTAEGIVVLMREAQQRAVTEASHTACNSLAGTGPWVLLKEPNVDCTGGTPLEAERCRAAAVYSHRPTFASSACTSSRRGPPRRARSR